jgi:hypothetical protein
MNKKQKQAELEIINTNLRTYLALMARKTIAGPHHHNAIAISKWNTPEHEALKTLKAHQLLKAGHTIITEGILKTGARPDILLLDTNPPHIYEIIVTETEEHALEKKERYMQIPIHLIRKKET